MYLSNIDRFIKINIFIHKLKDLCENHKNKPIICYMFLHLHMNISMRTKANIIMNINTTIDVNMPSICKHVETYLHIDIKDM